MTHLYIPLRSAGVALLTIKDTYALRDAFLVLRTTNFWLIWTNVESIFHLLHKQELLFAWCMKLSDLSSPLSEPAFLPTGHWTGRSQRKEGKIEKSLQDHPLSFCVSVQCVRKERRGSDGTQIHTLPGDRECRKEEEEKQGRRHLQQQSWHFHPFHSASWQLPQLPVL